MNEKNSSESSPITTVSRVGTASEYWQRVSAINAEQRSKGIDHYGTTIENTKSIPDMASGIRMLEEELIDALNYCEWLKEHLR